MFSKILVVAVEVAFYSSASDQLRGDYSSPDWYKHPPGTVANECTGAPLETIRSSSVGGQSMPSGKTAQNLNSTFASR